MQERGKIEDREMYGTFNMGVGYAFMVPHDHALGVVEIAKNLGLQAWDAGVVEEGPKRVIIEPKGIVFDENDLNIR
jgi:phosphoribosylformylglycinamidine cyclo-ligase